jgi:glycosyltransferase involved in cell wall biosynthesis
LPRPNPPRVSIIIRTKDRTRLLARALDDVLAQDYGVWELVVINDGGDPRPVDDLVGARSGFVSRSQVIHLPASQGMEAASNAGISATSGEFVAIHDDDDTWSHDFLSTTVAWLDAHNDDVAVTAATQIVIERMDPAAIVELRREPFGPPHDVVTVFDLITRNQFVPISLLVRRSAIDAVGGFDETLPVVGDWDFHLRLALHGHVAYLAGPARAFWHQRPDARGELLNSVNSAQELHRRYDRLVRDRALRAYIAKNGWGESLYLGKVIDERIAAAESHTHEMVQTASERYRADLDAMEARLRVQIGETIRRYSPGETFMRNWKRLLRGFR